MKFLTLDDPKDIKVKKTEAKCHICEEEEKRCFEKATFGLTINICFECVNQLDELI